MIHKQLTTVDRPAGDHAFDPQVDDEDVPITVDVPADPRRGRRAPFSLIEFIPQQRQGPGASRPVGGAPSSRAGADRVCDRRCRNARADRAADCACVCGGENHGAG